MGSRSIPPSVTVIVQKLLFHKYVVAADLHIFSRTILSLVGSRIRQLAQLLRNYLDHSPLCQRETKQKIFRSFSMVNLTQSGTYQVCQISIFQRSYITAFYTFCTPGDNFARREIRTIPSVSLTYLPLTIAVTARINQTKEDT